MGITGTISRGRAIEKINELGRAGEPFQFLISFDGKEHLIASPGEAVELGFYLDMPGWNTAELTESAGLEYASDGQAFQGPVRFDKHPADLMEYQHAFNRVMEEIRYGKLKKWWFEERNFMKPS